MVILIAFLTPNTAWTLPQRYVEQLRIDLPRHTVLDAWDRETLSRLLPDADVALTSEIDPALFATARRLRWVQSPAVGVGSMLFPELVASPVVLTSARGIRARAMAEHVMSVTLALARQLHTAIRRQTTHTWALNEIGGSGLVRTLEGRRMTIVGLGSIGVEVARLAVPFGMHVSGIRRRVTAPLPDDLVSGAVEVLAPVRLFELLTRSDIVVLSAPLTADTRQLIGPAALAGIKRGALLVNIGRGKLLDDMAVIDALRDGRLGGAALDVFTHEPLDPESPYWDLPNVIVTPHISGGMEDYWTPLVALFADNVRRFEADQPLRNVVDKAAGY